MPLDNLAHDNSALLPKTMDVANSWVFDNPPDFFVSFRIPLQNPCTSFHWASKLKKPRLLFRSEAYLAGPEGIELSSRDLEFLLPPWLGPVLFGGNEEIRTLGPLRSTCFRDRGFHPLTHISTWRKIQDSNLWGSFNPNCLANSPDRPLWQSSVLSLIISRY